MLLQDLTPRPIERVLEHGRTVHDMKEFSPDFYSKYAPPFEKDIAIWKRNCANTESAAVRKSEEDHRRVFSIKREEA